MKKMMSRLLAAVFIVTMCVGQAPVNLLAATTNDTAITPGTENAVTIAAAGEAVIYSYTPGADGEGEYVYYSLNPTEGDATCDPSVVIYTEDANGDPTTVYSQDGLYEEDNNFYVECTLQAGVEYFFANSGNNGSTGSYRTILVPKTAAGGTLTLDTDTTITTSILHLTENYTYTPSVSGYYGLYTTQYNTANVPAVYVSGGSITKAHTVVNGQTLVLAYLEAGTTYTYSFPTGDATYQVELKRFDTTAVSAGGTVTAEHNANATTVYQINAATTGYYNIAPAVSGINISVVDGNGSNVQATANAGYLLTGGQTYFAMIQGTGTLNAILTCQTNYVNVYDWQAWQSSQQDAATFIAANEPIGVYLYEAADTYGALEAKIAADKNLPVRGMFAANGDQISGTTQIGSGSVNIFAAVTDADMAVSNIVVDGADSVYVGESINLTATATAENGLTPSNVEVAWSSSDNTIATVDANGTVNGLRRGTVTITATATDGSGVIGQTTIEVQNILADSVTISGANQIVVGNTTQLSAVLRSNTGKTPTINRVAWSSSSNTIATVSSDGVVTARALGTVTITATSADGNASNTYQITVVAAPAPTPTPDPTPSFTPPTVGTTTISSVSSASYNKLKVTWTKVNSASGYIVYRKAPGASRFSVRRTITNGNTVTFTDSGIQTGKTYSYQVVPYMTVNGTRYVGTASKAKSGKTKLAKVTLSNVRQTKARTLRISWKKVSGANGYVVYRSTKKARGYKAVKTINKANTVSFTNNKLSKGRTYYYKIRAYRTVSGKKVYGAYSSVKSKKVTR